MQINFMRPRKIASTLSILLVVLSIFSLSFKGLNAGLDFTGGTLIEIKLSQSTDLEEIREVLGSKLEDDFQVSYFGSEQDVLIKIPGGSENNLSDEIVAALKNSFQFDLRRKDFIGPQIGEELRDQGGLGILAAMLVMMVYIMFRFQFKFAIGALLALIHDVLIVLGFFSIFYIGFNLTVLAAILAVIGYSLNDTIVVSDRIRENYRRKRKSDNVDVINRSLNQMLGRTLITSLTTLLVLFALLILGGDFIQNFAIALICGVIIGTYSSIYVLCNNLILMNLNFEDLAIKKSETYDDGMP
jgi:preprotein translocase subunit SecF